MNKLVFLKYFTCHNVHHPKTHSVVLFTSREDLWRQLQGHCCGRPHAPGGGWRRTMTVSGRQRAAVGYRGRRLEREVDESGGRRSQRQSRTLDMRLMRCWALAQHDIRYSIFLFLRQSTWDSKWKSVGEESIQTILDKCDVRSSTLIFSIRSTWAGPRLWFLWA